MSGGTHIHTNIPHTPHNIYTPSTHLCHTLFTTPMHTYHIHHQSTAIPHPEKDHADPHQSGCVPFKRSMTLYHGASGQLVTVVAKQQKLERKWTKVEIKSVLSTILIPLQHTTPTVYLTSIPTTALQHHIALQYSH